MAVRPAIEGGRPVRNRPLPYGHQRITDADVKAVASVLRGEWITQGPMVERFERSLARRCRAKYAVAMSSGTAALHAACAVAGLRSGTEGITTPITFSASANAIAYCGARPRFVDAAEDWPLLDSEALESVDGSGTLIVVPVDYGGHPAPLDEIRKIASARGWAVIEDAAHALGSTYKGKPVGTISDMTIFSFHPVKQITTGEGGAVVTNDGGYADALRSFRHHGIVKPERSEPWFYDIPRLGHNFRLTDFQCALGLRQLERLSARVARRRAIATRYAKAFRTLTALEPPTERPGCRSSYHIYPIRLRLRELKADRRQVFDALRAEGLGVQVHYIPAHLFGFYRSTYGYKEGDFPRAEAFYSREITLPLFDGMSDSDVEDVVEATTKVLAFYTR